MIFMSLAVRSVPRRIPALLPRAGSEPKTAETLFRQTRVIPDEKVSRAAFGGQHSLRMAQERLREERARLGIAGSLSVMKSKQLALFGPVAWDFECDAHQLLRGELRRVLAVDDGGDDVGRQQGKT